jgi:hypothetical protein
MAKKIETIADCLGAKVIARVPKVGGGAFGAARSARIVEQLRSRLLPSQGRQQRHCGDGICRPDDRIAIPYFANEPAGAD